MSNPMATWKKVISTCVELHGAVDSDGDDVRKTIMTALAVSSEPFLPWQSRVSARELLMAAATDAVTAGKVDRAAMLTASPTMVRFTPDARDELLSHFLLNTICDCHTPQA